MTCQSQDINSFPARLIETYRVYSSKAIQAMLETRDLVGFHHACILLFLYVYTHVGRQQPSTTRRNDQLITGVTGADRHRCRRLCSTWRSWRSPVKHPLSQTTSQDSVGVCTVRTSATFMRLVEATRQKCFGVNHTGAVLCLPKSHSERCQSPYTSCICGGFVCWQEEQCDKTAGRLASISPPQALCLTLYTSLDALNSFALEELSCVLCGLCFQVGERKSVQGYRSRNVHLK